MAETKTTSGDLLRRIADVLGVPIETFYELARGPSADEIRELLTVFMRLRNPQARRRVLAAAEVELRKES